MDNERCDHENGFSTHGRCHDCDSQVHYSVTLERRKRKRSNINWNNRADGTYHYGSVAVSGRGVQAVATWLREGERYNG